MTNFFKRWKEGIKTLTVSRQIKAKLVGQVGTIVGISLALVVMCFQGLWHFTIFMGFFIFLQIVDFIGTRQQYEQIKKIEKELYEPQLKDKKNKNNSSVFKDIDGEKV